MLHFYPAVHWPSRSAGDAIWALRASCLLCSRKGTVSPRLPLLRLSATQPSHHRGDVGSTKSQVTRLPRINLLPTAAYCLPSFLILGAQPVPLFLTGSSGSLEASVIFLLTVRMQCLSKLVIPLFNFFHSLPCYSDAVCRPQSFVLVKRHKEILLASLLSLLRKMPGLWSAELIENASANFQPELVVSAAPPESLLLLVQTLSLAVCWEVLLCRHPVHVFESWTEHDTLRDLRCLGYCFITQHRFKFL